MDNIICLLLIKHSETGIFSVHDVSNIFLSLQSVVIILFLVWVEESNSTFES